ncbi:acyl carrier protein [Deinococcus hopiensis]|uniref:Acyl carrier protein n=1 Tax=Deinococcus hopiensis KR-140 TaxID=695939 RepID=A0A1W1U9Q2_9DEIO|nr:acyl carrier protein [Deinococcus hopiensis]SMB77770.1 Acyl carrier protein [Deinococcus hopiensis KR-140]
MTQLLPTKQQELSTWLTEKVAEYVQREPGEIDASTPLSNYGLDSVYSVNLCGELEDKLGVYVDPLLLFDYPTILGIVAHFYPEI